MEKVLEVNNIDEMKKIATEWFSIIPGMDKPMQVPVVQAQSLTEQEFKTKWVAKNTPCLIKGAVKNSSASKKWKDKNYWLAACSNEKNDIVTHMNYFSWKRKAEGRENVPFHEAIERLYQGNDHIFSMPARIITEDSLFAGIIKDLPQFPFLTKKKAPLWDRPRVLYIYRRASTAWHVHNCDETLMSQVKGAKLVALLPPDMPKADYVTDFLENELYLEGKTLDKSLDLKPRLVTVEEGDALYIPPHWFHCVVPKDGEVGFTFITGFRSPWHIYGNFRSYFVRKLYKRVMRDSSFGIKLMVPVWGSFAAASHYWSKLTGKK